MRVGDFDFALPPELIAQEPTQERSAARLMRLDRISGAFDHYRFADLPSLLHAGDLLVVNDTRVFPARLLGYRVPSRGAVECLLIQRVDPPSGAPVSCPTERWEVLVHPGQKLRPGSQVAFAGSPALYALVLERRSFGRRVIELRTEDPSVSIQQAVDAIGHMPLPPYIRRDDAAVDRERYQTVYAAARGSIAAPTAGLHFGPPTLAALESAGVELATVTLHVGYGTFQPVRTEHVEDHVVAEERFAVSAEAAARVNLALDEGRRVIAVGTTTTRTLEAAARAHGGRLAAGPSSTDLFIYPGFEFQVVRGLITNFHLPRSSLLMLACAFGGRDAMLAAYRAAVAAQYRFYSYGDAMLVI